MSSGSSSSTVSRKRSRKASTTATSKRARSFKARSKTTVINPRYGVVAPRLTASMKYYTQVLCANVAGVYNTTLFNLNSLFDPDLTGSGHQPMGFDNIASLYSKYVVKKVHWYIEAWVAAAATVFQSTFTVVPVNQVGAVGAGDAQEQPLSSVKTGNFSNDKVVFTGSINLWDLSAKSKTAYMGDDIYSALCSATPSERMTLQLGSQNALTGTQTCIFAVMLTYDAEFFDPIPIGGS